MLWFLRKLYLKEREGKGREQRNKERNKERERIAALFTIAKR